MAKLTRNQFIAKLAPYAIADMKTTNIAASLTIAQGILESADGNSSLTVKANNLFGIKGKGTAGSITLPTMEYVNGKPVTVQAAFRKYNNWGESVLDHSKLILNGVSWNRKLYHGVIGKRGKDAAYEVAKAGYATDPKYANKLIALMDANNLYQYDIIKEEPQMPDYSKEITALQEEVSALKEQLKKTTALQEEVSTLKEQLKKTTAPKWFTDEFPGSLDQLQKQERTADFWEAVAFALRVFKTFSK